MSRGGRMSAAVAPALSRERTSRRIAPRYRIAIPVDVTVLRSGIPDRVPGRSLNLGSGGIGAAIAAELFPGQSVGVEFHLPYVGLPLQTRALVRHQESLHYGLQFLGLTAEQQAMLGYWSRRTAEVHPESKLAELPPERSGLHAPEITSEDFSFEELPHRALREHRTRPSLAMIFALLAVVTILGWWHWERGWKELETHLSDRSISEQSRVKVPASVMERRLTHKVDPTYSRTAHTAQLPEVVVLDAVVGKDGTVIGLHPRSGPTDLATAASEAVRWWRFEPYRVNGQAVEVETTLALQF